MAYVMRHVSYGICHEACLLWHMHSCTPQSLFNDFILYIAYAFIPHSIFIYISHATLLFFVECFFGAAVGAEGAASPKKTKVVDAEGHGTGWQFGNAVSYSSNVAVRNVVGM